MYADFFGLRELPFNNTPDPRFFYSTPDHEEALASLIYAVKQRKGFVLVTGEVGAGKTLVSRLMLRQFGGSIVFANINHAVRTAGDLMESLCTEFELPFDSTASHIHLVRVLHDFLLQKFAENVPVVLVLDEAQNLPMAAFEQLRMIGNLEADDAKLLQIAILGQPELRQLFQTPELRQLKQRLFSSYHLPALDRAATDGYIRYRLSVAGSRQTNLFRSAAVDKIYEASRGIPRLINTFCDNAMLSAYSAGRRVIDEQMIDTLIAQMAKSDEPIAPSGTPFAPATPPQSPISSWSPPAANQGNYVRPSYAGQSAQRPWPAHTQQPNAQPNYAPTLAQRVSQAVAATTKTNGNGQPTIRERLEQAKKRAAALEWRYNRDGTTTREALNTQASLKSTTQHAQTILDRIESAAKNLKQREKAFVSLSGSVRQVAAELTDLLHDVRKTSNETRRDSQRAKEMHERLVEITRTAAAAMERGSALVTDPPHPQTKAPRKNGSSGETTLLKAATALIKENKLAAGSGDLSNLGRVLSATRKSSDDLRSLAKNSLTTSPQRLACEVERLAAETAS